MKICIPVAENKGIESLPYNHFGTAPKFIVVNPQCEIISEINNGDLGHEHGKCQPLKALQNEMVDVVLVGGIGAGAVSALNSMGVKVFKVEQGSIEENVKLLQENKLTEFTAKNGCNHHGCSH